MFHTPCNNAELGTDRRFAKKYGDVLPKGEGLHILFRHSRVAKGCESSHGVARMRISTTVVGLFFGTLLAANAMADPILYNGYAQISSPHYLFVEGVPALTSPTIDTSFGSVSAEVWQVARTSDSGPLGIPLNDGFFHIVPGSATVDETFDNVPFHIVLNFLSAPTGGSSLPSDSAVLIDGVLNGTFHAGTPQNHFNDAWPEVTAQVTSVTSGYGTLGHLGYNIFAPLPFPLDAIKVDRAPFLLSQQSPSLPPVYLDPTLVPEPASIAFYLAAVAGVWVRRRPGRASS
jgi:hypothetical protein